MKKITRKMKKISKLLFGRTAFVIFSVLMQLAFFIIIANWMYSYSVLVYIIFVLIGALVVIHIFNENSNASFKMAWMLPVLIIPVFGTLMYIFVNLQLGTKIMRRRLALIDKQLHESEEYNQEIYDELEGVSHGENGLSRYLYNAGDFPAYKDNGIMFFPLGENKFEEMQKQLKAAKKFIFMEYFIVTDSYMWRTILDILKQKAAEGVEVRFMYDGMCSLMLLPYGYYKELEKFGIQSRPFSQIRPVLSTVQNNRDHRKILVIDGETVFTGGINLADEYIDRLDRFGHWKDTAVMIKGDAVKSFTYMFLKMWQVAGKKSSIEQDELKKYILNVSRERCMREFDRDNELIRSGGYVIPYGDSPFSSERIGKRVYVDILNRATKYVHIMTPYLILDDEMIAALCYCAKRGVETIIIMPHIPDKVYAYLLARTYYLELIEKGVHIYEYTPGFVHAKEFISDDVRATVGTVNLDFRSMYLHFECGAYIYKNEVIRDIELDFMKTLEKCQKITPEDCKKYPWYKKAAGQILRLIAPLM